MDNKIF